ncbi:DNA polymerase III subunit gamma/tau [Leifsonia sp. A12D58]|uniref:DNA polymerase III subunit gamma/tau n=1 Tax=Leifsonia sp. A12D58 TaxID=3397674 RepID=UPI0039E17DD8
MSSERDDDALNWAGDDDATLVVGQPGRVSSGSDSGAETTELPDGWTTVGKPGAVGTDAADEATTPVTHDGAPATQSSIALVGMGIFAGIYLLYIVGWYIGTNRIGNPISDPVGEFMFSLGAWLAIASPLVWFASVYWLTTTRPRLRLLWLFLGLILLAPFPFIFGVGVTS